MDSKQIVISFEGVLFIDVYGESLKKVFVGLKFLSGSVVNPKKGKELFKLKDNIVTRAHRNKLIQN